AVEHGSLDGDAVSVILASLRIHRPRTKLGRPQPHGNSHHRRPRFLSFLFAFFPPNFVPGEQHHNPSCSTDIPPPLSSLTRPRVRVLRPVAPYRTVRSLLRGTLERSQCVSGDRC